MADFASDFWHWFIAIVSLVSILVLFPFIYLNRGKPNEGKSETMGHVWDDDLEEYNNPLPGWWFNLFLITLFFGLGYLLLYPGLGKFEGMLNWSSTGQYHQEIEAAKSQYDPIYERYAAIDIVDLSQDLDAMKTGARLFINYCSTCHGSDARGSKGFPNLQDHDWLYGSDPAQIKTSILDGRTGIMPPWEAVIGKEGSINLAHYVLELGGRDHEAALAEKGAVQYGQLCVGCHMPDGTGNPALGAPNLTDRIWLYGGSLETIAQSIEIGRSGVMPAHRDFLGENRVHLLAAYVYSLSQEYEQE
ncbi:MAG: cytochrome-c oxidase, cbb3-type subunit III [Acidiferrobacterales bacterium]|nr:cytochrome-c oxidase, cbb3-type subunit III [Acidiferrobacterales bacterium]